MMRPWSLTHGVGVGDFFDAEAHWSPERKATLTTVWHAWPNCPGSQALQDAMRACPDFHHVDHKALSYPTEIKPGSVLTLRDQPIFHRLKFYGSSFLEHTLDCEVPGDLPERFVYIQPSTPKNGPNCGRWLRDEEWIRVIDQLEIWDAAGLVANIPGGKSTVPAHPRLVDCTGRTSMPQAIEILKRAAGYIGVDSCFAILAAQLFGPDRLKIRTNNPFVIDYPWLHYPGQHDFSFLYPSLDRPAHPNNRPAVEPGTIVDLRVNCLIGTRNHSAGDRAEMNGSRVEEMIRRGQAVPVPLEDLELP